MMMIRDADCENKQQQKKKKRKFVQFLTGFECLRRTRATNFDDALYVNSARYAHTCRSKQQRFFFYGFVLFCFFFI